MKYNIIFRTVIISSDFHQTRNEGMSKSKRWSCERIDYSWINFFLLSCSKTGQEGFQVPFLHDVISENNRQKFVVGDVLKLRTDDPSGLLVERLVVPSGVQFSEFERHQVVLSRPNHMHRCQMKVLVGSFVARFETISASSGFFFTIATVVEVFARW